MAFICLINCFSCCDWFYSKKKAIYINHKPSFRVTISEVTQIPIQLKCILQKIDKRFSTIKIRLRTHVELLIGTRETYQFGIIKWRRKGTDIMTIARSHASLLPAGSNKWLCVISRVNRAPRRAVSVTKHRAPHEHYLAGGIHPDIVRDEFVQIVGCFCIQIIDRVYINFRF